MYYYELREGGYSEDFYNESRARDYERLEMEARSQLEGPPEAQR